MDIRCENALSQNVQAPCPGQPGQRQVRGVTSTRGLPCDFGRTRQHLALSPESEVGCGSAMFNKSEADRNG